MMTHTSLEDTDSFAKAETASFEAPISSESGDTPIDIFLCIIESLSGVLLSLRTLSSKGEISVIRLDEKYVPVQYRKIWSKFRLEVLANGRYKFHYLDTSTQIVQRPIYKKIDKSLFRSVQPELAEWLREVFQGGEEYEVDELDGLSRVIFRIRFSSRAFNYTLLSSTVQGLHRKNGVITCTAIPRRLRRNESKYGYEIPGGPYDINSWNRITQKITTLETLRALKFKKLLPSKIDPRTL